MKWYEKVLKAIKMTAKWIKDHILVPFIKTFNTLNKMGMFLSLVSMIVLIYKASVPFGTQMNLAIFFIMFIIFAINVNKEHDK